MKNERVAINQTAYFDTFLLHQSQEYNVGQTRPLVIVCPGGGYAFTSDREAEPIALKFNSIGFNSLVLQYTTGDLVKNIPQNALYELAYAVKYAREHAAEWLVDPNKIFVCGFSAGGHLALHMATKWADPKLAEKLGTTSEMLQVNAAILGYPLVYQEKYPEDELGFGSQLVQNAQTANERIFGSKNPSEQAVNDFNLLHHVSPDTPPTFLWHTTEDVLVDVEHSLKLALALRKQKVPFEMYIFEKGEHGLALCDRTTARKASHHNAHVINWFTLCAEWLAPYVD
ncbi:alpha/beta hydrolase [Listeria costaricensis]|uniref:alpha/beta hydrolase n=1 Tax=Listeria costaricensis TaxID=2026604 RepID=UPI000C07AA1F|nr:alpha/beta hydrolase [Listeria costaricensis]